MSDEDRVLPGQPAPDDERSHPPVSVAVVDDNPVIRMGLKGMLALDRRVRVVGDAGDGEAAIELIRATLPDVTLLDVRMPRRDGVQVADVVRQWTRTIMMTYADTPDIVRAALDAGAAGYLVHGQFEPQNLVSIVLSTAAGSSTFSPAAVRALTAPAQPTVVERPDFGLSARQREIMEAIASGQTNTEIAAALFLAEKTVKNHINQIFARMQVRSRAEAVAVWLSPTPPPR
jgi:DNA-binding NarL/FixJ family response regulator